MSLRTKGLSGLNSVLELDGSNVEAHRLTAEYLESHLAEHPEYAELAKKHRERVRRADLVSGYQGGIMWRWGLFLLLIVCVNANPRFQ